MLRVAQLYKKVPPIIKTEVSFSRSQQTSADQYRNQQEDEPSPALKIQFHIILPPKLMSTGWSRH
jgi:hypothetical protein